MCARHTWHSYTNSVPKGIIVAGLEVSGEKILWMIEVLKCSASVIVDIILLSSSVNLGDGLESTVQGPQGLETRAPLT